MDISKRKLTTMTVAELIERLKEYPQNAQVICDRAYEDGYWPVEMVQMEILSGTGDCVYVSCDHNGRRQKIYLKGSRL